MWDITSICSTTRYPQLPETNDLSASNFAPEKGTPIPTPKHRQVGREFGGRRKDQGGTPRLALTMDEYGSPRGGAKHKGTFFLSTHVCHILSKVIS